MKTRRAATWAVAAVVLLVVVGVVAAVRRASPATTTDEIPTAHVKRGELDLKVHATGELRAKLVAAGFTMERLSYANFFLFPLAVLWRRLPRTRGGAPESDVRAAPAWLNRLMGTLYRGEATLLKRAPLPVGTSVLALARKE